MVRERVKYFYSVGDDRPMEIHDATTDVDPEARRPKYIMIAAPTSPQCVVVPV
jgi:hypothetical protein